MTKKRRKKLVGTLTPKLEDDAVSVDVWKRVCAVSIAFPTLVGLMSLYYWQWHWFARSGAILVAEGIVLTSSQFIVNFRKKADGKDARPFFLRGENRIVGEWFGVKLLIWGTLIWVLGDLPQLLPPPFPMPSIQN